MSEKQLLIKPSLGFTLIELLVVISIIAVLTAVLSVNFMGARQRASDAQKIEGLNQMKNALRMYYNDHQSYPAVDPLATPPVLSTNISSVITKYMPQASNIGFSYTYSRNDSDSFVLTVPLEAGAGTDDTDSQVKCGIGLTADKVFAVCAN
jgi:general secretion pathway protein G